MKKDFLFVTIILIFIGCAQKRSNPDMVISDNDYSRLELSADTAFNGVRFGISYEQAFSTELFNKTEYDHILIFKDKNIGDFEYESVTTQFYKDSLYLIQVYSYETSAFLKAINKNKGSVCDYFYNLDKLISSKYGDAEIIGKPYSLVRDELIPGTVRWCNIWESSNKTIKIGIEESIQGDKYRVVANIYRNNLFNSQKNENESRISPPNTKELNNKF